MADETQPRKDVPMKTLLCAALALFLTVPALSRGEDEAKSKKPADAKKPIYDEKADSKAQIQAALSLARRENRRVLIQWGGNWCSWCLLLHERFKSDRDLAVILRNEYVVVAIDSNNNIALADKYGAEIKKHGVP